MTNILHRSVCVLAVAFSISSRVALAQNQSNEHRSLVCVQIDADTGECEWWEERITPLPPQQIPYGGYSYQNDIRLPAQDRIFAQPSRAVGSGIMPSGEYAPGFGTSHKPIYER